VQKNLNTKYDELTKNNALLNSKNGEITKLESQLITVQKNFSTEYNKLLNSKNGEITKLKSQLTTVQKNLNTKYDALLNSKNGEITKLESELTTVQKNFSTKNDALLNSKNGEITKLESQLKVAQKNFSTKNEQLKKLESQLTTAKKNLIGITVAMSILLIGVCVALFITCLKCRSSAKLTPAPENVTNSANSNTNDHQNRITNQNPATSQAAAPNVTQIQEAANAGYYENARGDNNEQPAAIKGQQPDYDA